MNRIVAVLFIAWLANSCVSATGISDGPSDAPEMQSVDGVAGADDDRPNYMPLDGNSFNDNDLPAASQPPASMGLGIRDADGLTRGLYGWSELPRLPIHPDLLAGLRAALDTENDLFEPQFDYARNLPKRAPTGFTGMRGRRIPSGFNGMRGKKSFSLFSWNNQAARSGPNSYRDGKRAPSGFLGMRGKKSFDTSLDERWRMDDSAVEKQAKEYPNYLVLDPTSFGSSMHMNAAPPKRVPNGFMGLRG